MYTDWILIHRLALELSNRFSGARVQGAGQLTDGRFALQVWQRGTISVVAFDVFAQTPVVTVEAAELTIEAEPGFVRRSGAALRGMSIEGVRSRKGDRVLRLEFGARSRFGVENGYALIAELVPKFGNLLLVKDQTIVSALKEFSPADNARRSVAAGDLYEPPPLPLDARVSEPEFITVLDARERGAAPSRAVVAAFRGVLPLLPQMPALSILTQALADAGEQTARELSARLVQEATDFLASVRESELRPLVLYREDHTLVQAHVTDLFQFAHLDTSSSEALLPLLSESRTGTLHVQDSDRVEKRRRSVARTLKEREERLRRELRDVKSRMLGTEEREGLREEGQAIFATLHERAPHEQETAKAGATALFARYQKLGNSIPHLKTREATLSLSLTAVSELQWELERAADEDVADVEQAVEALDDRAVAPVRKTRAVKRKPLSITTASGSRILIGRSPLENAELTFHVARPDDLWFHTQKIPGAHVILQRDDKAAPPEDDLRAAAEFAAYFSKAKESPKVLVDYTHRKHVRKQPAAPPGLVFYTHAKSLTVEPKAPVSP